MIVLFGGLAKSGELIMRPIREAMEKNLLAIYKGKVKLVLSELKESDAAVLGASALGWEARLIGIRYTKRKGLHCSPFLF